MSIDGVRVEPKWFLKLYLWTHKLRDHELGGWSGDALWCVTCKNKKDMLLEWPEHQYFNIPAHAAKFYVKTGNAEFRVKPMAADRYMRLSLRDSPPASP